MFPYMISMRRRRPPPNREVGPRSRLAALPMVVATETIATLRCAGWPLALLRPLPTPPPRGDQPPVVLVHGFMGHPAMFRSLIREMYQAGLSEIHTVHYPSTQFALDEIARRIHQVVDPLAERGPVDLVGHSLGAVASRAYLKAFGGAKHVRRFVSLGGPHAGTALYWLAPRVLWDVLNPNGPWVQRLARGAEPVHTVVVRSRYDHHVVPPIRASLPGVEEVVLTGQGHNGLLWSQTAAQAVIEALTAPLKLGT